MHSTHAFIPISCYCQPAYRFTQNIVMFAACWKVIRSDADVQEANDKSGKPYYKYEILTRTGAAFARAWVELPSTSSYRLVSSVRRCSAVPAVMRHACWAESGVSEVASCTHSVSCGCCS